MTVTRAPALRSHPTDGSSTPDPARNLAGVDDALSRAARVAARALCAPAAVILVARGVLPETEPGIGLWTSGPEFSPAPAFAQALEARSDVWVEEDLPVLGGPGPIRVGSQRAGALYAHPLRLGGRFLGQLCVLDVEARGWGEEDVGLMRDLAEATAEQIALRAPGGGLSALEAASHAMLEHATVGLATVDGRGRVLRANRAFAAILGQPPEVSGLDLTELSHPEDREQDRRLDEELASGTRMQIRRDRRFRRRSGEWIWTRVVIVPVSGSDRRLVQLKDITEERRATAALVRTDQIYRALAQHLPGGSVLVFDHELRYTDASGTQMLAAAGLSPESLIGRTLYDVALPQSLEAAERLYLSALGGQSTDLEVRREGRILHLHGIPVRDDSGIVTAGMVVVFDVTERARAASSLRSAMARIAALMKALPSPALLLNPAGKVELANATFHGLSGLAGPLEVLGKHWPSDFQSVQLPCDAEALRLQDGRRMERDVIPLQAGTDDCGSLVVFREVPEPAADPESVGMLGTVGPLERTAPAQHDELTDLHNRRGFFAAAARRLRTLSQSGGAALLVAVDVDGIRTINDRLGHEAGDRALRETGALLRRVFQGTDVVARIGGDEFAVLAVDAGELADVEERIGRELRLLHGQPGMPFRLGLSVAAVPYDPEEPGLEELLAAADAQLRFVKRARRRPAVD